MSDEKPNPFRLNESQMKEVLETMRAEHRIVGIHDSVTFDVDADTIKLLDMKTHALDSMMYMKSAAITGRMTATGINMQQIPRSYPYTTIGTALNEGRELFRKTADSIYDTIQAGSRQLRRRYGGEFVHRRTQAQERINRAYNQGGAELGLQRVAKEQADLLRWLNEIMNEKRR